MSIKTVRPFMKWAGGKTQLIPAIAAVMPRTMRTYYEPFLGGGAMFFHVSWTCTFERAVLNDWNKELINTYEVVRDSCEPLMEALVEHMTKEWNTSDYFYAMRAIKPDDLDPIARAARMIYLNKTCFNGLFRMNRSGQFNVPFGKYKNPSLFDADVIHACSEALQRNVALQTGDFTTCLSGVGPGDVIYFDPPYVPVSETSNFASYTSAGFSVSDQHRLAICFKSMTHKGATCILSNSDSVLARMLYADSEIYPVQAKRHINSNGEGRGNVGEIIVVGRPSLQETTPISSQEIL